MRKLSKMEKIAGRLDLVNLRSRSCERQNSLFQGILCEKIEFFAGRPDGAICGADSLIP